MGTVGYMSPEQVRGEPVDARTDLFALGAVLYEMLSGQRAFRRDTAAETMTAILKDEPPSSFVKDAVALPARVVRVDTATGTRTAVAELTPPDRSGRIVDSVDQWEDDGGYSTYEYQTFLSTLFVVTQGK